MRASTPMLTPHNSPTSRLWGWADEAQGQRLEVLHDGGEVELVAGAGQAAQAHALEAMMGFQVCKAHLDPFSQIARLEECLGLHLAPGHVAGIFVDVAQDAT